MKHENKRVEPYCSKRKESRYLRVESASSEGYWGLLIGHDRYHTWVRQVQTISFVSPYKQEQFAF